MPQDLDQLQGTWTVQSLKVEGQTMAGDTLGEARIDIAANRFTSTGMGTVYGGTFELDATHKPARIDMKFDSGPEKGNTNLGIYELKDDAWKLCLATRGSVRPTKFASPAGSGFALETLVRGSAAPAGKTKSKVAEKATPVPAASGTVTEFEGEWAMLSGVMDGKPMDASLVKWVKRVTQGNRTSVLAGPQVMLKVSFTFDPSQSPQTMDYLNLAGAHKGKNQLAIYKLEGDVLTVCAAAPGTSRPAEFTSSSGDGRTLTAWKRA